MFDGKEKENLIKSIYNCFTTQHLIERLRESTIGYNKQIIIEILSERGIDKDNLIFL